MSDAYGNDLAVDLLEKAVKAAKAEPIRYALVVLAGQNVAISDMAGDASYEPKIYEGLNRVIDRLSDNIESLRAPDYDTRLNPSFVCYNMATGPLGFDFVHWLIDAEMMRRRKKAPAPLKVGFWLGRPRNDVHNVDQRELWINNVFRPLLPLMGAMESEEAIYGQKKDFYGRRDIIPAVRNGEPLPLLRALKKWDHQGHVTITLREKGDWSYRNSDLGVWLLFASWLEGRGERVLIVRDTAKAHEPLDGFETVPGASINLHSRVSLYESAKMNFFSANGPSSLCEFGVSPWMAFVEAQNNGGSEFYNTPDGWEHLHGVKPGEKMPWERPDRRFVWEKATFPSLKAAWLNFVSQ